MRVITFGIDDLVDITSMTIIILNTFECFQVDSMLSG